MQNIPVVDCTEGRKSAHGEVQQSAIGLLNEITDELRAVKREDRS